MRRVTGPKENFRSKRHKERVKREENKEKENKIVAEFYQHVSSIPTPNYG